MNININGIVNKVPTISNCNYTYMLSSPKFIYNTLVVLKNIVASINDANVIPNANQYEDRMTYNE
jgi:hypothetical protein